MSSSPSFARSDEYRSSYHGSEAVKRGRAFFRRGMMGNSSNNSPNANANANTGSSESPLLRRKQLSLNAAEDAGVCLSGPSSLASSRESSVDRAGGGFHALVERVRSSPKLGFRRLQVMRSGSFNDVGGGAKATMEAKRRRWLLGRSESLRARAAEGSLPPRPPAAAAAAAADYSPWSSPEMDRRGSLPPDYPASYLGGASSPLRERSLDRVQRLERRGSLRPTGEEEPGSGKVKGFVNRLDKECQPAGVLV